MIEFLLRIFDPVEPPASPGSGGLATPTGWFHFASDMSIFFAYTVLCGLLMMYLARRRAVPHRATVWLIWLFLLTCGVLRLLAAAMFYYPAFNFFLVVKVITALIAVLMVFGLAQAFPAMFELDRFGAGKGAASEAEREAVRASEEFAEQRDKLEQRATQLTVRDRRVRRALEASGSAACCWDGESGEFVWDAGLKDLLNPTDESGQPARSWRDVVTEPVFDRIVSAGRSTPESGREVALDIPLTLTEGREGVLSLRAKREPASPGARPLITGLVTFLPAHAAV